MSGYTKLAEALLRIADVLSDNDPLTVKVVRTSIRRTAELAREGRITPPGPVIPIQGAAEEFAGSPLSARIYRCECAKVGWDMCQEHGQFGVLLDFVEEVRSSSDRIDEAENAKETAEEAVEEARTKVLDAGTSVSGLAEDFDLNTLRLEYPEPGMPYSDLRSLVDDFNSQVAARIERMADLKKQFIELAEELNPSLKIGTGTPGKGRGRKR